MKKKSDLMDGILFYEGLASEKPYPSQVWDYPEILVEILKTFIDIWCLPEGAIPRKMQKGKYANWIAQLEQLRNLFSSDERMRMAMKRAYENLQESKERLIIYEPRCIHNLVVDAIGELRREEKNRPVVKIEVKASPDKVKNTVRDLKSMFNEE